MTYRDEIMEKIREQYPYLSSHFNVQRIGIFGSVARQSQTEKSDIDIMVEFRQPIGLKFISLVEFLEKLFARKVDVLTKEGIENIRVKKVSSRIKKEIIYV